MGDMKQPKLRVVRPDDPPYWDWPLVYDYRAGAWTNINRPGASPFWDRTRWRGITRRELYRWDVEQEQIGLARVRLLDELADVGEVRRGTVERSLLERLEGREPSKRRT